MRGFDGTWVAILGPAVEAARAVLRDLEDADLTPPLRRVAAHQGGRLPPPLAVRLLKEIDENEWFRSKVADAWDSDSIDPSGLFLTRPQGWWIEIAAAADEAAAGRQAKQLAELSAKLEGAERKRLAAAARAKDLKRQAQEARRTAKEAVDAVKKQSLQRFEDERAEAEAVAGQLAEMNARLAALGEEHQDLLEAYAALRSRFAKARRSRVDGEGSGGGSSSVPADPVRLARLLDLQTAEFGRHFSRPVVVEAPQSGALALAAGVRPDGSDAIRWLVDLEQPVTVLVDGYNAQFHIDRGDFTSGVARRNLVAALKRLRAAAAVRHRFVVVYDSTMPGERDARTSLGGVEVRFAEEDRIADEEIVEITATLDQAVVISSDRAVREGAEANGAVVLWSEALGAWLGRV